MQRLDRWLGLALALLACAVLWSSRSFPNVPGQKVGAGFLPMLVGAGLLVCALVLVARSLRASAYADGDKPREAEHFGAPLAVIASIVIYIGAADRLGFLLVAPVCLVLVFRALGVSWRMAVPWALCGTLLVHVAFYKLLRVPLPWGVFRPFY